jgi:hypothetical protein
MFAIKSANFHFPSRPANRRLIFKEPNNDGWQIQSALEQYSGEYEKSVGRSMFLAVEDRFARLQARLESLVDLHASISDEGEEAPSATSIQDALAILKNLKNHFDEVESVVPSADGGVAIVLAPSGEARAYFHILNDGGRSLVMYDKAGTVDVVSLPNPQYLELLKSHFVAKELAGTY